MVAPPDPSFASTVIAPLFESGRAAEIVLAVLIVEGLVMVGLALRREPVDPRAIAGLLANLLSGAGLVLALRAALRHEDWPAIAAFLLLSFAAHGVELALRTRRRAPLPIPDRVESRA